MILKLLGLIDLGMALMLTLISFGVEPNRFYILFALAHALKAMLFIKDILSIVDIIIVIYTFILLVHNIPILTLIIIIFLAYKGLYSFA